MLILGLLLAAAALVVFGYMLFGTQDLDPLQIDLGVFTVELTPMHLYLLGAATLVVLVLGLLFLTLGLRAQRRRRREVKELRAAVRDGEAGSGRGVAPEPETAVGRDRHAGRGTPPGRAGDAPYERDVTGHRPDDAPPPRPGSGPGGTPPPSPQGTGPGGAPAPPRGSSSDVALPSDYPRDDGTTGTTRP